MDSDAPELSTPPPEPEVFHASGAPVRSTSQSSTRDSSSVSAGEDDHSIPCTFSPAAASSPSTAGGDDMAWK